MKPKIYLTLLITIAAFVLFSCKDQEDPFEAEKIKLAEYFEDNNIVADTITDGLYYISGRTGIGNVVQSGSEVSVLYTGRLIDGTIFPDEAPATYSFIPGQGQAIEGWEQGIPGLREGDSGTLIVRSDLGYGSTKTGIIPPYSTLIFDIIILTVE